MTSGMTVAPSVGAWRQIAAAAVVALVAAGGFLGGAAGLQLVGGAEAFVGVAVVE